MEIVFRLSEKDLVKFYKLYLKNKIQQRPAVIIGVTLLFIVGLAGQTIILWRFLFALIASPIISIALLYYLPLAITLIRFRYLRSGNTSYFEDKKLTVLEGGVKLDSVSKSDFWKWESMTSVHLNKQYLYITLVDKRLLPVPIESFQSETEVADLFGRIQSNLSPFGGSGFPVHHPRKNPSYYWGFLCLVPIAGGVAGLIFIANGISNYKDKYFVLIGLFGILFNAGLLFALFHFTDNFGFDKVTAVQSQRQLNGIMKAVEFYKIKNGAYPDSLKQINNDNSEIWIYDPLQPGEKVNKENEFNYQKVDDHYYLFSSGIDHIPDTKDDIYPQVAKPDSAKFGLIHK